ncbi:hypothetical protein EC973_006105 [Apophysomyces ossiformis]|uniref:HMG box domain-containing protein n=1 Tax=Apophysomyces ossiformis TaxID=679940 RepID=A0A8H7BTP4_9FUNG|nr:hypothetical protein EC973_006105 [Apophysomyces ossiformis]
MKAERSKVKRPPNCFILFRKDMQKKIVALCPGANHRDISTVCAKYWREMTEEDKTVYKKMAEDVKQEHLEKNPGYRYKPEKRGRPRPYKLQAKNKFTSRSEENNRMMEILYENPRLVERSSSSSACSTSETMVPVVKYEAMEEKEEEKKKGKQPQAQTATRTRTRTTICSMDPTEQERATSMFMFQDEKDIQERPSKFLTPSPTCHFSENIPNGVSSIESCGSPMESCSSHGTGTPYASSMEFMPENVYYDDMPMMMTTTLIPAYPMMVDNGCIDPRVLSYPAPLPVPPFNQGYLYPLYYSHL